MAFIVANKGMDLNDMNTILVHVTSTPTIQPCNLWLHVFQAERIDPLEETSQHVSKVKISCLQARQQCNLLHLCSSEFRVSFIAHATTIHHPSVAQSPNFRVPITLTTMPKSASSKTPNKAKKSVQKTVDQENFEKELQTLAAKAKEETFSKWATQQAWVLMQSGVLLTLAAMYSNVSQLNLSPVYGSIPASIYHQKGVMAACFLGWSSNLFIRRLSPVRPLHLLPVIAAYIPMLQFFLFQYSGYFGGKWGPVIIEGLTFLPLLLLSVSCTATILGDLELTNGRYPWVSDALPGVSSFVFYKGMEYLSGKAIQGTIGSTFYHTRLGLQILLSALYTVLAPSQLLILALPAVLHTTFYNTHVPSTSMTTYLNNTMAITGWSLLERKESLTGYLSIIESKDKGFRIMRCDHSLLGGEWLPSITQTGHTEPIYGIFVMLEAVRLVKVPNPVPDNKAKALVMYVPAQLSQVHVTDLLLL